MITKVVINAMLWNMAKMALGQNVVPAQTIWHNFYFNNMPV